MSCGSVYGECQVTWFLTMTGGHIAAGREVGGRAEVSEGEGLQDLG